MKGFIRGIEKRKNLKLVAILIAVLIVAAAGLIWFFMPSKQTVWLCTQVDIEEDGGNYRVKILNTYDENGKLLNRISYDDKDNRLGYANADFGTTDSLQELTMYNPNDELTEKRLYTFDVNGNLSGIQYYDENSQQFNASLFNFGECNNTDYAIELAEKGIPVMEDFYDVDGKLLSGKIYSQGKIIDLEVIYAKDEKSAELVYTENGVSINENEQYIFHDKWNLSVHKLPPYEGEEILVKYTYDKNNNLISVLRTIGGEADVRYTLKYEKIELPAARGEVIEFGVNNFFTLIKAH